MLRQTDWHFSSQRLHCLKAAGCYTDRPVNVFPWCISCGMNREKIPYTPNYLLHFDSQTARISLVPFIVKGVWSDLIVVLTLYLHLCSPALVCLNVIYKFIFIFSIIT